MSALSRIAADLEKDERLDPLVDDVRSLARNLPDGRLDDVLRGKPLGHALHPVLTNLPLGFWFSASALDLFGGRRARPDAARLIALGILAAAPTALSGVADWRRLGPEAQRVGLVHAVTVDVALSLYISSLVARRRGRHALGVLAALAGATTASVGGYLGGHLVLTMKVTEQP